MNIPMKRRLSGEFDSRKLSDHLSPTSSYSLSNKLDAGYVNRSLDNSEFVGQKTSGLINTITSDSKSNL